MGKLIVLPYSHSMKPEANIIEIPSTPKTELKVTSVSDQGDVFECETEVSPIELYTHDGDRWVSEKKEIEELLAQNKQKLSEKEEEIDIFTNHADKLDYIFATCSGIFAGLVDSFFVGEFSLTAGEKWSVSTVNKFVMRTAKKLGYKQESLNGAVAFLEYRFGIPSDSILPSGITKTTHHLDDLTHHPSLIGLIASLVVQFTGNAFMQNASGDVFIQQCSTDLIGSSFRGKIVAGILTWFYHLLSDVAGSRSSIGAENIPYGMGLPGPIGCLIKELAMLPGLKKSGLSQFARKYYVDNRIDLRKELAVAHQLGKQALPVILNEILVRAFYFLHYLVLECRRVKDEYGSMQWEKVNWKRTLPFKNRTIIRMLTIATGTFTAVDLADAAIRGAVKSGGNLGAFGAEFALRVNYVGFGRFAMAVYSDVKMGAQLDHKHWEKIVIQNERIQLLNARVSYKQADVWVQAENTEESVRTMCEVCQKAYSAFMGYAAAIVNDIEQIDEALPNVERQNPGLIQDMAAFMDDI